MSDLNEVIVSGRLTRDSELRYTPGGTAVTDVIVASNRIWSKDSDRQEETTFVDVTIWGKQAESLNEYLVKGRHIMVVGRLKLNKWETEEGDKRSKLTMVAEKINLTPGGGSRNSAPKEKVAARSTPEEVPFQVLDFPLEHNTPYLALAEQGVFVYTLERCPMIEIMLLAIAAYMCSNLVERE